VHSAGASGAVFGVVGGLLVFMMSPRYGVPRLMMGEVGRSALLIVVINLGLGASIHGIDNAAHIGGLASGLVAGSMLARPLDPDYRRSHPLGGIGMTLLFLGALLLGSITLLTARADVARAAAVSAAPHFHVARPDPDDG
jgi:rhomboid protease GluP